MSSKDIHSLTPRNGEQIPHCETTHLAQPSLDCGQTNSRLDPPVDVKPRTRLRAAQVSDLGHDLALSMKRLIKEVNSLTQKLRPVIDKDDESAVAQETEKMRRSAIAGGYRLANDLRKIVRAQRSLVRETRNPLRMATSAKVIDINMILHAMSSQLGKHEHASTNRFN